MRLLILRINFYVLRTLCPHLGRFCVVFFFHYISAKFHLWPSSGDLPRPRIGMLSLVTVSPVITAFHNCCLSHHVFDQVNLWLAWVGFETAIFWQCLTWNRRDSTPLSAAPRRAIKDGFFGLINPYLFFQSRVCTEFLYLSLIGIILRWGFLFWELIFMYCGLYVLILVVFVLFSFFTTFRPNFTSGLLQVIFNTTSDRNAESCNRIPSNYCLP